MTEVPQVQDVGGVLLIDVRHQGITGTIGSYLVAAPDKRFALIETGPGSTVGNLEAGIRGAGYRPANLTAILVTHIHLDHAGAAGLLARDYGAPVYVHEEGAPHLADPSRLLSSARRLYKDELESLWGDVAPVPGEKLRPLAHRDTFEVLGRRIDVIHTPGHASSHVSYLLDGRDLFSGDAAGIRVAGTSAAKPATAPPEIDLEAWDRSFEKMRTANPRRLLLSHFGPVSEVTAHLEELAARTREWAGLVLEGLRLGEDDSSLVTRIAAAGESLLEAEGADEAAKRRSRVTSDYRLTALGLKRYWLKHHPEVVAS